MKLKVLLLENIHPSAEASFKAAGFDVRLETGALSESELIAAAQGFDILGIRSKTQITKKVLEQTRHLSAVGAFCIGTNQIHLEESNALGIPVFNAPYSNTRSVAELVIAEMIALSRQLGDANRAAHAGQWLKSAHGAYEVRGKTLGIVGYGHIGSQVSVLAESLGLKVLFYDVVKKLPLGNAMAVDSLDELLKRADFVTLHVPETPLTHLMVCKVQLSRMKKGSYLINASRGSVVQVADLADALRAGHLRGAALDVFPEEPKNNKEIFKSEVQNIPNVILTPHIGGSTEEAQEAIGREVSYSLIQYAERGVTLGAVNFPQLEIPPLRTMDRGEGARILNVHQNVPGVLGEINGIVSKHGANIRAQYLSTDSHIGYLVMDLETQDASQLSALIGGLPTSIKTRYL